GVRGMRMETVVRLFGALQWPAWVFAERLEVVYQNGEGERVGAWVGRALLARDEGIVARFGAVETVACTVQGAPASVVVAVPRAVPEGGPVSWTVREFAAILKVTDSWVYRNAARLPFAVRVGGGWRFDPKEIGRAHV